jgi:hypothetical protein
VMNFLCSLGNAPLLELVSNVLPRTLIFSIAPFCHRINFFTINVLYMKEDKIMSF